MRGYECRVDLRNDMERMSIGEDKKDDMRTKTMN
jgi:hypothetical protein